MTTAEITNRDNIIDSRDIIARIKELEAETELSSYEQEELDKLRIFKKEIEDDFSYSPNAIEDGITLINDCYFEDYARELAIDLGEITNDMHWPATCIDWEAAAKALQMDYTEIDFDGWTFYARE